MSRGVPFPYAPGDGATTAFVPPSQPSTKTIFDICTAQFFSAIRGFGSRNKWEEALRFIPTTYSHDPPDFRSTFRKNANPKNAAAFRRLQMAVIGSVVQASAGRTAEGPQPEGSESPGALWWLLFHLEMLIFAPTARPQRNNHSINLTIKRRILEFRGGDIEGLYEEAMAVSSWLAPPNRVARGGNRAAQAAADSDNFRTAKMRFCQECPVATINDGNVRKIEALYPPPLPPLGHEPRERLHSQEYRLPGDICKTILSAPRTTAAGVHADTIDAFANLLEWEGAEVRPLVQTLCDLVYRGIIPDEVKKFFSDTYLFCLYKEPGNHDKLRPIGVPTALRRIVASHIVKHGRERFARDLLPYNFAIGVKGGMNFIIKATQL
ncbi:hypothetical protein ACHAWF_006430, partial [Thalassiosira exigua]